MWLSRRKTYLIGWVGFRSWSRIYHFWANIVAGLNPVWKRGYSVLNFGVVGRYLEDSISDVTCIIKSLYILRSSNVRGRSPPECGSGHSACTRVGNTTVWPEGIVEMMMWSVWRHLLTPNLSGLQDGLHCLPRSSWSALAVSICLLGILK